MLGHYEAETIEVDSETLLVAGMVKADDVVRINSDRVEFQEELRIPEPLPQQASAPEEAAAENPPAEALPSENPVQEIPLPAELPASENPAQEVSPSVPPQTDTPALPALADIGTTRIGNTAENAEAAAEIRTEPRTATGLSADLLDDGGLLFAEPPQPGTLPETVSTAEPYGYAAAHQTLPGMPEHQETPLI